MNRELKGGKGKKRIVWEMDTLVRVTMEGRKYWVEKGWWISFIRREGRKEGTRAGFGKTGSVNGRGRTPRKIGAIGFDSGKESSETGSCVLAELGDSMTPLQAVLGGPAAACANTVEDCTQLQWAVCTT